MMSHFLILILFFVFLVCLKIHDYHMNHRSLPILELINVRNSLPLLTSVFLNEQPTSLCFCSYLTYSRLLLLTWQHSPLVVENNQNVTWENSAQHQHGPFVTETMLPSWLICHSSIRHSINPTCCFCNVFSAEPQALNSSQSSSISIWSIRNCPSIHYWFYSTPTLCHSHFYPALIA